MSAAGFEARHFRNQSGFRPRLQNYLRKENMVIQDAPLIVIQMIRTFTLLIQMIRTFTLLIKMIRIFTL